MIVSTSLLAFLALAQSQTAPQQPQGHDLKAPEALKQLNFMLGDWTGKQDFNTGGPLMVLAAKDKAASSIGGRYIEETLATTRPDGTNSDTRHLLTYIPASGKYHAWWFNDSATGAMELEGTIQSNGKLVMTTVPSQLDPTPTNVFRVTYERTDADGMAWTLELKDQNSWRKLFKTTYTKSTTL